jgi:hypothetical protein
VYLFSAVLLLPVGRDSSVGIATLYGLEGPGIESRWGRDYPHPPRPALGPTQPPMQWVLSLFPGCGVDHPPSSSVEVKERVELYFYSPSGPSWPILGRILPLPLPPPAPHAECVHNLGFSCTIECIFVSNMKIH